MNITIENKKQKAIELMQKLDIYKPYIKGFKEKTDVCFFECFGGYWAYIHIDEELFGVVYSEQTKYIYGKRL